MKSILWTHFALYHFIRRVTRLRDLENGRTVDWSDEWTAEDIADARHASPAAFDERESGNG